VAHPVDTAVHSKQDAVADPPPNLVGAEADRQELPAGHDAVLAAPNADDLIK
jgi:hypothetical protein